MAIRNRTSGSLPCPLNDYGGQAQKFREIELTGTKFTSILKLELFMLPLILITSFVYWGFLWHTNDIPSAQFPYAQKFWPLSVINLSIWTQINSGNGASWALHAIKGPIIGIGAAAAFALYGATMLFKWPLLFFYGFIGNVSSLPHDTIPTFIGALLGRYYFAKRFGLERWQLYTPVLLAGLCLRHGPHRHVRHRAGVDPEDGELPAVLGSDFGFRERFRNLTPAHLQ